MSVRQAMTTGDPGTQEAGHQMDGFLASMECFGKGSLNEEASKWWFWASSPLDWCHDPPKDVDPTPRSDRWNRWDWNHWDRWDRWSPWNSWSSWSWSSPSWDRHPDFLHRFLEQSWPITCNESSMEQCCRIAGTTGVVGDRPGRFSGSNILYTAIDHLLFYLNTFRLGFQDSVQQSCSVWYMQVQTML